MKNKTKDERLQIRVTPELKARISRLAEQKGLSISTLVLTYVSQGMERDTQTEKMLDKMTEMLSRPENVGKLAEMLQTKLNV